MNWLDDLPQLPRLAKGPHAENSKAMCAMELVAFMERERHSDRPVCTCPVLASFVRELNDGMPDARRNELLPVLTRLVGTRNKDFEIPRATLFAMRVVTDLVPIALDRLIDAKLVQAMRDAKDLKAANAAAYAAYAAANAAYAANAVANAANAVAYAAYAAANAAYAAAYAACAAAKAAAYAACAAANAANAVANAAAKKHDFWAHAIRILIEAIELDPSHKPAIWDAKRVATAPMEFV